MSFNFAANALRMLLSDEKSVNVACTCSNSTRGVSEPWMVTCLTDSSHRRNSTGADAAVGARLGERLPEGPAERARVADSHVRCHGLAHGQGRRAAGGGRRRAARLQGSPCCCALLPSHHRARAPASAALGAAHAARSSS
eukprot:5771887-Prymnesium_polylepis.1